ncbi:thioredoxin family protein [Bosea sp. (in: a-proteobacteria)]|uniref:thioredoxin family protein n=1 Tax=Bosea sp. (in: a-proteobacteria) TaxID=1871050 RepID=UPI002FC9D19A
MNATANVVRSALVGLSAMLLPATAAGSAELLMFEREGCIWCARWDREVGPAYDRTAEGRAAPLRRIDLGRGGAADPALARPVRYTPTFVLVEDGREVGRITGYLSNETFWGLLGRMLADIEKPIQRTRGVAATMEAQ